MSGTRCPGRSLPLRAAAGLLLALLALFALARPAAAHPFGEPQQVTVAVPDLTTVELTWNTGMADDYTWLAAFLGLLPEERILLDGAIPSQPGDVDLLAASPELVDYLAAHLQVATAAGDCAPTVGDTAALATAGVRVSFACPSAVESLEITVTTMFDVSADYKVLVSYGDLVKLYEASAPTQHWELPAVPPAPSVETWGERFGTFFVLGAEHLLFGIDHILFLAALIVGSRRLREVVLVATAFTLAHSITFVLAALGTIELPGEVIEPVIAASIAVVGGWHLFRLWRDGRQVFALPPVSQSDRLLDPAGWVRLAVVFGFGLVHGLGFAGALGIDEPFSWTLLANLLVFNVGIEVVQIGLIALTFPLLSWLRRVRPTAHLVVSGVVAGAVTVMALWWFLQRTGVLGWAPFNG